MFNRNWPVWVHASVQQYFLEITDDEGLTIFYEGEERKTEDLTEYAEVRVKGPVVTEPALNQFNLDVEVNVLISVKMNDTTNILRPHVIAGWFMEKMQTICIKNYGPGTSEPYTEQFHLRLREEPNSKVVWQFFGKVETDTGLLQGVVSARYRVHLQE